jgi:hypothetical protein
MDGGVGLGDRVKLPLRFDPARLAADVARMAAGDWIAHFVRRNYAGDWSVIPLRGPAGATHPVLMIHPHPSARAFADAPALSEAPYLREVLAGFLCPLQCVRLMRLGPGSAIEPHRDHDLDFEHGVARIHVPVSTNPQVEFRLNGTRVDMAPGEAWCLRLSDIHSVENRGGAERVHLVIDAEVNDWLAALMAAATPR